MWNVGHASAHVCFKLECAVVFAAYGGTRRELPSAPLRRSERGRICIPAIALDLQKFQKVRIHYRIQELYYEWVGMDCESIQNTHSRCI